MFPRSRFFGIVSTVALCMGGSGCSSSALNVLNPFDQSGPELGEQSLAPILGEGEGRTEADQARQALEVMGSYQRTLPPKPYAPVMQPAQVRLMWIPDHINKSGDLVPAHYYYLKVLDPIWNVQDAFDIERQLNVNEEGAGGGATPWVYSGSR